MSETYTLQNLKECVNLNDHYTFLMIYLHLMKQGENLTIPQDFNPEKNNLEWDSLLTELKLDVPEGFIPRLSQTWLSAMAKHSKKITLQFPQELIAILQNNVSSQSISLNSSRVSEIGPVQIDHPENPITESIEGYISKTYHRHKKALETTPIATESLQTELTAAIQKNDPEHFLYLYLSQIENKQIPELPLSTVNSKIKESWKSIIQKKLSLEPAPAFIDRISSIWFYLMNKKNIPLTDKALADLLIFYKMYRDQFQKPPADTKTSQVL